MVDLEADLKYWEDRLSNNKNIKEENENNDCKLSLKNINEYLFIRENRDIIIDYVNENGKESNIEFNITELTLYDIFTYLSIKNTKDIDYILYFFIGENYYKISDILDIDKKEELLIMLEELSSINEMFKSSPRDNKDSNNNQNISDCIEAFGGTIIFLCEEWGKVPEEILKSLTYRQFKWYLDIIVKKQEEINNKVNGKKINNSDSNKASNLFYGTNNALKDGYCMVEDSEGCVIFKKVEKR